MEEPTTKQQITEILKQAEAVVITTSQKPNVDQIAGAIALNQMLEKLGKRPEPVVSVDPPANLGFLPLNTLHKDFRGLRDFVIELDTSKTEADKLKYVPDGKRLKIFITPFNGTFAERDVAFSYGDYHCDAVVMLGASGAQDIDKAVASQTQLLGKTKLISIVAGEASAAPAEGSISWHESGASSVCEMLMSVSEALQPGLLDNHIATALLTGLVGATEHFTAHNTTPKVMTMAAQLMAAGADQGSIIKHLEKPQSAPTRQPVSAAHAPGSQLEPSREASLPHPESSKPQAPTEAAAMASPVASPPSPPVTESAGAPIESAEPPSGPPVALPEIKKPNPLADTPVNPNPPPKFAPPPPAARPLTAPAPLASGPAPAFPAPNSIIQPQPSLASGPSVPQSAPKPPAEPASAVTPRIDIEAARREVEEATRGINPPLPPGPPQ